MIGGLHRGVKGCAVRHGINKKRRVMTRAFMIGAVHSGAGKTTVAMGIMAALRKRGLRVQPFKVGPDFIDPGLHSLVCGADSCNLDIWMAGADRVRRLFASRSMDADVSVVEGVMGLYDGGISSSASVAGLLGLPVVLLVDARSMAESAAAVVQGFRDYGGRVSFVVFNRVSSLRHREMIEKGMERVDGVETLGFLPSDESVSIPGRHLGLHTADEAPLGEAAVERLAGLVEEHVDLDRLLELACCEASSGFIEYPSKDLEGVRIAVARDRAFSFYYVDFLETLRAQGAELVFFSPLFDEAIPEGIRILYLGGGYPELYAEVLSENTSMRESVRRWALSGGHTYAECGGFMYLTEGIRDFEGLFYPMAGVFPTRAVMRRKGMRLGYREVFLTDDCIVGDRGDRVRGHEFHYSDIDTMPGDIERIYEVSSPAGIGCGGGFRYLNTIGSYIHLYLGGRGFRYG